MKCTQVRITLFPEDALRAGLCRLAKEDDEGVVTREQAEAYRGVEFNENGTDCSNLHLVYRDGLACVNFENENGERVNYDYPIHSLKRVSHIAG